MSGDLRFFWNDDGTTVIVATVWASSVHKLLLVAVGAFGGCRGSRLIVRAALSPACF